MNPRVLISSVFLVTATTSLCMAAPADDYLREKKQAVADIEKAIAAGSISKADDIDRQALPKVQASIRQLLGPLKLKGFAQEGRYSIETLEPAEEGSGKLDGLYYDTKDGKRNVIVSTKPLLQAWQGTAPAEFKLPADLDQMISTGAFYAAAINVGADVHKYADLPVTVPKPGIQAKAILFRFGQDEKAAVRPNEIGVTLIQGDQVYVLWQKTTVQGIPDCAKSYKRGVPEDGAYQQCYTRNLPSQRGYDALLKQAQAVVDELSAAQ